MNPTTYPDSSFLISLVCRDANSPAAAKYMQHNKNALTFTPLHRIETRNALRNAAARGEITEEERKLAFRRIDEDLKDGFFIHTPFSWPDILRRADELSERHREKDGQRTLDLLHVATSLELCASFFLSFDKRQRRLALAAGLQVKP